MQIFHACDLKEGMNISIEGELVEVLEVRKSGSSRCIAVDVITEVGEEQCLTFLPLQPVQVY